LYKATLSVTLFQSAHYFCRYGVPAENIVLYGQSIGTVPTVDLARKYECAAVILHSPLMSGMRVAFPRTKRTWFFDAFPRYEHEHAIKIT